MPIQALLRPRTLREGDTLSVHVEGAEEFAGQQASLFLATTDTIETSCTATLGVQIGADGTADGRWENVGLVRETAVFAAAIGVSYEPYRIDSPRSA